METMRSLPLVGMSLALAGCVSMMQEPRGATMKEMAGDVSLVFTNASPDAVCELNLSSDGTDDHGDNWLPTGGLASGKSIDFKVKPGKYKAVWSTCRAANKPYYAGTRWREDAVEVRESTQLFAYVASNRAPTSIAPPRDHHRMVRFAGQSIDPNPRNNAPATALPQPQIAAVAPPSPTVTLFPNVAIVLPEVQAPEVVVKGLDPALLRDMIDPKLVAEAKARAVKNRYAATTAKAAAPTLPMAIKPSVARGHDVASQQTGYRIR
jgi:hypothetical protein